MRLIAYSPVVRRHIPVNRPDGPKANILKKESGYEIELAVPGFEKSDFEIRLDQEVLVVSGSRPNRAAFERRFALPDHIVNTEIEARYENGILRIMLPERKVSPRRVEVA